jgi:F-type H+-transporting ATPase subunit delta
MAQASQRGFDAGREHLGTVYAQALLGASEKAGITEQVMAELDSLVNDVFLKLPSFQQILSAPKIPTEEKERLIERVFANETGTVRASKVLVNALKVMARHGRIDVLTDVRDSFRRLFNELRGRVEVQVRSASALDNGALEQIAQQLRARLGRQVDLKVTVDPELLGGIVVRVGDTLLDGSLKTKLNSMREKALRRTEQTLRTALDRFVAV